MSQAVLRAARADHAVPAQRPDWLAHTVLGIGVLLFALPVWLVLAGATQDSGAITRGELSLLFEALIVDPRVKRRSVSTRGNGDAHNFPVHRAPPHCGAVENCVRPHFPGSALDRGN